MFGWSVGISLVRGKIQFAERGGRCQFDKEMEVGLVEVVVGGSNAWFNDRWDEIEIPSMFRMIECSF